MHLRSAADILASEKPAPLKRSQKSPEVNPLASDTRFTQFSVTTASTPISLPWTHQRPNTCHLLKGTMDLPPAVLLYQFSVTTASNVFYLYCSSTLPEIFESDSGNLNVIMKQLCFQRSHNSLGFPGQFGLFLMCRPWENKLWVGNMNGGKRDHVCLSRVTWLDCSGEVEINEPFMEVGVGAARYRDLNSDLPSCISKFHIQDGHEPNLQSHWHFSRLSKQKRRHWCSCDLSLTKIPQKLQPFGNMLVPVQQWSTCRQRWLSHLASKSYGRIPVSGHASLQLWSMKPIAWQSGAMRIFDLRIACWRPCEAIWDRRSQLLLV